MSARSAPSAAAARILEKTPWPGVSMNASVLTAFACADGDLTNGDRVFSASASSSMASSAESGNSDGRTHCVMPPASYAATSVLSSASSSVVLPWSTCARTATHPVPEMRGGGGGSGGRGSRSTISIAIL